MTKKAYLVTFEITTRVIADVHDGFDPHNCNLIKDCDRDDYYGIEQAAINHIEREPTAYLDAADIEEDTDCPYGTFKGED